MKTNEGWNFYASKEHVAECTFYLSHHKSFFEAGLIRGFALFLFPKHTKFGYGKFHM